MACEIVENDHFGDESDSLLSSLIDGKLQVLSPSRGTIFKVPKFLRDGNEKAYEPHTLAIGPYHRGKHQLSAMEEQKMCYLKKLLARQPENSTRNYVSAMRKLEERARACYVDSVNLNSNEFVEMMILDACFIVEIVRNNSKWISSLLDPLLQGWMKTKIQRDLLLVENQLPLFVLKKFFDMTKRPHEVEGDLCNMIFEFFKYTVPKPGPVPKDEQEIQSAKHLLGLLHGSWEGILSEKDNENPKDNSCGFICSKTERGNVTIQRSCKLISSCFHSCNYWASNTFRPLFSPSHCCSKIKEKDDSEDNPWAAEFIRCATELKESGIEFKKFKSDNLFDIQFKNGIMKIPTLAIDDISEPFFRNLIAYEQFSLDASMSFFIDYIIFMDGLMNTSKDVELLCRCGIIFNVLGDDDAPANIFNRLCDNITGSCHRYRKIIKEVNHHCHRPWNKRLAKLRHNYFNSPWALISFLAALLLLLLTVAQTVFSVLAYIK